MLHERIKSKGQMDVFWCVVQPSRQEDLGFVPSISQTRHGGARLLPNMSKVEEWGLEAPDHPWLHSKFKGTLGNRRKDQHRMILHS